LPHATSSTAIANVASIATSIASGGSSAMRDCSSVFTKNCWFLFVAG